MNAQDITNKSNALVTALANLADAQTKVDYLTSQLAEAQSKLESATTAAQNAQQDLNAAINPPKETSNVPTPAPVQP